MHTVQFSCPTDTDTDTDFIEHITCSSRAEYINTTVCKKIIVGRRGILQLILQFRDLVNVIRHCM